MWYIYFIFITNPFFGSFSGVVANAPKLMGRVVGGSLADIHDFSYQLSLEYKIFEDFEPFCGATVISKSWAVSAAHCVNGLPVKNFRIRAGTSNKESGGKLYNIAAIIPHPDFNESNADYDISVIRVAIPFQYSDVIQPVSLPQVAPPAGTLVTVSGWGSLETGGSSPIDLQQVSIYVVDHDECIAAYHNQGEVTTRMLCAGVPEGGKSACSGDSGGPLVAPGNQLVGVVSWGLGCGDKRYPGVYADVAYFRKWISSTTGV